MYYIEAHKKTNTEFNVCRYTAQSKFCAKRVRGTSNLNYILM